MGSGRGIDAGPEGHSKACNRVALDLARALYKIGPCSVPLNSYLGSPINSVTEILSIAHFSFGLCR